MCAEAIIFLKALDTASFSIANLFLHSNDAFFPRLKFSIVSLAIPLSRYEQDASADQFFNGNIESNKNGLVIAIICVGFVLLVTISYLFKILRENRKLKSFINEKATTFSGGPDVTGMTFIEKFENLKRVNTVLNLAMEAGKHAPFVWKFTNSSEVGESVYSDRYYELLGYEPQEFILTHEKWKTIVHPKDFELVNSEVNDFLNRLNTDNPKTEFTLRYRLKRKENGYIWIESKGRLYDESDEVKKVSLIGLVTDITERIEAESELRNNEERFKKIFEADTNGMFLIDEKGQFVMCNNRACQLFGYEKEEFNKLKVEDLVPEDLRGGHSSLRANYFKKGDSRIMRDEKDFNALTKRGEQIKVQIGLNPVIIKNERFVLAIIADMTQRVKMENELIKGKELLQLQKDKYETIFQNINDGLFVVKVLDDGTFIYREFNRAHEKITGLKSNSIADKKIDKVFPGIANYLDWRYSVCRDSKEVITFQERLEFKKKAFDFQTSLVPVIQEGKVVKIIGISRDITSMLNSEKLIRAKEQKLRYALEASEDAFIDWDLLEMTFDVSPVLYRMLGYEPSEKKQTLKSLFKMVSNRDLKGAKTEQIIRLIQMLKDDQFSVEFRMIKHNKDLLWVRLKGKVVERQGDKVKRFVGTISDISDEKEKTREKLETILATENNERNRIAKEIHDGLQQTLTVSSINMEYVLREIGSLSQGTREKLNTGWDYLQKSIAESRSVAHSLMPRDILSFGLVVAVKNLLHDYENAIQETSFHFYDNFGKKRIQDDKLELTLYRIIQESLNNIVKYAKASEVTVQLKNYDEMLVLTIEDNGTGFNYDSVSRKGEGFGLRSMRNRVEAVLGHLEIDTAPGRGTVVLVEIPLNENEEIILE